MNVGKVFSTIDTHVAGQAFRIVTQSSIVLGEADIAANDEVLQNNYQNEKDLLLNEPRGHRDMNGCIVVPSKVADLGLLFFNHEQGKRVTYSGLIATVTALLETGNLAKNADDTYEVETVDGVYALTAVGVDGEVTSVSIENESCVVDRQAGDYTAVVVDDRRTYVIDSLPESIPTIHVDHLISITKWGREVCAELAAADVAFDRLVVEEAVAEGHVRSVTFSPDGNIVRSPGVAGTFALLAAKPEESALTNESIFGSAFTAKQVPETDRYSIDTEAFVTGIHEFIFDEDDPLRSGFLLG